MRLFYIGSENSTWRTMLYDAGVRNMGLSYVGLSRRVKFKRDWLVAEHYPEDVSVFLDSGAYSVNSNPEISREETLEIARGYMTFISKNADDVEFFSEFDAKILGPDYIQSMREDFYNDYGDKFMPIWHSEEGLEELERLASSYPKIGILQSDVSGDLGPVLTSLIKRGVKLHGVAMTQMESMRQVKWDSVSSSSWLSPSQFGDSIIWDNATKTLHRYPKKYKESGRKRHRSMLTSMGFDTTAIESDNTEELLRVSVWSWEQFLAHINGTSVTNHPPEQNAENPGTELDEVVNPANETRNNELATRRETKPIPGMGYRVTKATTVNDSGEEEDVEEAQIFRRSESMRVCDNCFLKDKCPEFLPGSNCAYNIPLVIETPSQIAALQDSMITMQAQRVIFMQMVEEMEGGYVDENLSREIDRLDRMIKNRRESEKEGFTINISGSQPKGSSVISDLFGGSVPEPKINPISADQYIQQTPELDIPDAEIVDDDK